MQHILGGDLLASDAAILVNPVNCVGVMGAGLALQFKTRWPAMFQDYAACCTRGELAPGVLHVWTGEGRTIVNFPTKTHWNAPSRMAYIERGLDALARWMERRAPTSIAIPALGAGLGGLPGDEVLAQIEGALRPLARAGWSVYIYNPR